MHSRHTYGVNEGITLLKVKEDNPAITLLVNLNSSSIEGAHRAMVIGGGNELGEIIIFTNPSARAGYNTRSMILSGV